jgi:AraC-like DNA-binding protein
MPSSTILRFSDPDHYGTLIRAATAEMTISKRGHFSAELTRIDLKHLWMQRFSESLPRVAHSAQRSGRVIITLRTEPGSSFYQGGLEIPPNGFALSEGGSFYQLSAGPARFGSMSLPTEYMLALVARVAGYDLASSAEPLLISPAAAAIERLQRLHREAGHLAANAPEMIANPHVAYGLEQALIHAMLDCLAEGRVQEDRSAQRQHERIMRRFRQALDAHPNETLYLPAVCAMVGVSERTLRRCCQEQIGMGPMRFLLRRRMHLARRALRETDPAQTTVTAIATQYGFWELGRFATEYRSLFNESPSATLRRPPEGRLGPALELPQILAETA